MRQITQMAPWSDDLESLVATVEYRPGWRAVLHESFVREQVDPADRTSAPLVWGTTLDIVTLGYDSYHPERGERYGVHHFMPVPAATYDRRSWRRWLFEQYLLVERHEAMEFFQVDGGRPYAPSHGPGNDVYIVREVGTAEDAGTSFKGIRKTAEPAPS